MKRSSKIAIAVLSSVSVVAAAAVTTSVVLTAESRNLLKNLENIMINEFKAICNIPHSSDKVLALVPYEEGNVWKMSCYLREKFEQITGQYVSQDQYGNLWFDVPANCQEMQDAPKMGMQAHMDMVFSFDATKFPEGYEPDPKTTKIQIVDEVIDGKRTLHSKDYATSIGADNGLGVAQIMAILSTNKIKHGPLRVVITNCEENAMQGAKLLVTETNPSILKDVKYMLNIDGEDLGDICVACSGGVGSYYSQTFTLEAAVQSNKFTLSVNGLPGGHSGGDIDQRHINALKLVNSVLHAIKGNGKTIQIASISTPGCTAYNWIPGACSVSFATDATKTEIDEIYKKVLDTYSNETVSGDKRTDNKKYSANEIEIAAKNYSLIEDTTSSQYISTTDTVNIIELQNELQFGIESWPSEKDIEAMEGTQTSTSMGPVIMEPSRDLKTVSYRLATYSRSNDNTRIKKYSEDNPTYCHKYLGDTVAGTAVDTYYSDATFPGWEIDKNDSLRELCKKGWLNAGVDSTLVKFSRTHGGVEPAWWTSAMTLENTACISYGPQITGAHAPDGTVQVDTVQACLKTTIYMLEHAKELK